FADSCPKVFLFGKYCLNLGHPEVEVGNFAEYFPKRIRNAVGLKPGSGNLVKQWLKGVIIVLINEHYLKLVMGHAFAKFETRKASTYHNYPGQTGIRNIHKLNYRTKLTF